MNRTTTLLVGGACFVAGVVVTRLSGSFFSHPAAHLPLATTASHAVAESHAPDPAKPWGKLDAIKVPLANSEDFFSDRSVRLQPARWFFENLSETQLADLLKSCGLTQSQRTELLDQKHWQAASNGWYIFPANEIVAGLSHSARQQIYEVLAHSPLNYSQRFPFRFALGGFASRFAECELPPVKLEALQALTYTNSGNLCLADLELLTGFLTRDEFSEVIDCLYRLPAYRLRLWLYPDSDIEALVKYWGAGDRARRIKPLLESLSKVSEKTGTPTGIGFLLPSFARLRLFTFPDAWPEKQADTEDCFWTSMNFFNAEPDMRFLDSAFVKQALHTDYDLVQDHPTYGDLVTLISATGDALHMCVYIAEDYVFTKNGKNRAAPWVLMKIPDMLLLFPSEDAHRTVIFRRTETGRKVAAMR